MKKLLLYLLLLVLGFAFPVSLIASIPETSEPLFPAFSASTNATLLTTVTRVNGLYTEEEQKWMLAEGERERGVLLWTTAALPSGTVYYFLRYEAKGWSEKPLSVTLPIDVEEFSYRTITYPNGFDIAKSVWSPVKQGRVDAELPKETVFIDDGSRSLILGYVDVYEKQDSEVRKERYDLANGLLPTEEGLVVTLPQVANTIAETWGFVGSQPLVNWDSSTVVDLRMGDFTRVRKWTREGMLLETPSTYFPSSPRSFWLNPTNAVGEKFLRTYDCQFFEDFALVSLYASMRWQNEKGYWYTSPTSTWLLEEYGIGRYFYDTRFNTDQALFLLKGYNRYNDPLLLESSEKYANYLLAHIENHHFPTKNGGYLVSDYAFDPKPQIKTHVSLNHQLSEMNYLLELYKATSNPDYLAAATKLKTAVDDTAPYWKSESGDLHYAYLLNGTYGRKDYPLLTLKDLRYSQTLFQEVYGARDPAFDWLIQAKEAYLKKQGLPLY